MLVFGLSGTDQKKCLKKNTPKNHSNGCPDLKNKGISIFLSLFFNSLIEEQKLAKNKFHKVSSSWV